MTRLSAFWKAASAERPEFAAPLKLLLLTGCRAREIAELKRSEIVDGNIELPGTRTKNHKDHVVPLSQLARKILASVDQVGEYVFPIHGGRVPVELGTRLKDRLDAAMGVNDWILHDLRRSTATGMAKIGIAPHIVEAVLNHVSGAKAGVAGVYNKWSYLPEKKAALERWGSHIEGLLSGKTAKVEQIHAGACS